MQFTKTIFLDSVIFIEKKRVENRLWRKSAFCGEKVKNAGEKEKKTCPEPCRVKLPRLGGGTQRRENDKRKLMADCVRRYVERPV
jgi:hypothetical protein